MAAFAGVIPLNAVNLPRMITAIMQLIVLISVEEWDQAHYSIQNLDICMNQSYQ